MSDGVALRADVTLPDGIAGPFPTSLTITGYNKAALGPRPAAGADGQPRLRRRCSVDDRGTGASPGTWDAYGERPRQGLRRGPRLDRPTQSWSDGQVGVTGDVVHGDHRALRAAVTHHPAVKAVFAIVPMADGYRDIVFGGGQANTVFIPTWMGLVSGLGLPTTDDPRPSSTMPSALAQFQVAHAHRRRRGRPHGLRRPLLASAFADRVRRPDRGADLHRRWARRHLPARRAAPLRAPGRPR